MPVDPGPLTVADWQLLARSAAGPRLAVLGRVGQLLAHSPASAWIHQEPLAAVAGRLDELEARRAAAVDEAAFWRQHPLFGVPFVVKDNIDVAGLPTTAACTAFAYTPERGATAVQRLLDAGAVLLGKTNLDQFATGLVGARSPFGAPSSVFDASRVSGGSSSGSAVLVAGGAVPFSLGTDTAGSGRIPAGFNHIVGLKPTPGRVSTAGLLPACRSLDCISVFALTVDDAAAVLRVLEGPDALDDYSAFVPGAFEWSPRLRVGLPAAPVFEGHEGYAEAWEQACLQLESLGATAVPLDMAPLHAVAQLLYDGPWVAERYAAIQALFESNPDAMDATVRAVIGRAQGMSAVQAFQGQYAVQAGRSRAAAMWRDIDVLMVPTAPGHPTHAQVQADPVGANAALGRYTNFVNLLGWCALALPAGMTNKQLPFGVTFIAPAQADAALARWGQRWQQACAQPLGATGRPLAEAIPPLGAPWPVAEPTLRVAVVGAHLSGLPLNGQLTERRGVLRQSTHTAPAYRLYALPGTTPPKPGMLRVAEGGCAIEVEVWELPQSAIGSFLSLIPPPLGLGSVELADGTWAHGFLCEQRALIDALDISHHGGWRAHLAHQRQTQPATPSARP
jgi:allophanate hydrolase